MTKTILLLAANLSLMNVSAWAQVETQAVEYSDSGTALEGVIAHDPSLQGKRSAILIVHDWMGLSSFTEEKAKGLASQGYVAFAVDIYGKGVRPKNAEEAGQFATRYKSDRKLLRSRIRAAYDLLVARKDVNPAKILVMGYCFGGTTALELARSGAPLAGTVTFHGGLSTPTPKDAKNIHSPVLTLHGADDPYVTASEVTAFKDEMKKAGVKLTFISYPGAVHAFAIPAAGDDNSKGAAYNANADRKSWAEFQKFLKKRL